MKEPRIIREILRKANKVVACVWGIGERKWNRRERIEKERVEDRKKC
jgi:hypothetical protein